MKSSTLFVVGMLLLSLACGPVHPYFEDVGNEQDDLAEETSKMVEAMETDLAACERSLFSTTACDRVIDTFEEFSIAVDEARDDVLQLDPPSEATDWHRDYLSYLRDASSWADAVVTAYYSGDYAAFDRALAELEYLAAEEDRLAREFEDIQEELGAR